MHAGRTSYAGLCCPLARAYAALADLETDVIDIEERAAGAMATAGAARGSNPLIAPRIAGRKTRDSWGFSRVPVCTETDEGRSLLAKTALADAEL